MITNQHTSQKALSDNQKVHKCFWLRLLTEKFLLKFRLKHANKDSDNIGDRLKRSQDDNRSEPFLHSGYYPCEFERDLMRTLPPSKLMTNLKN